MNTEQKKLFRQIARCSIADEILDNLLNGQPNTHPCTKICEYQQDEIRKIGKKHGPDFAVEFSKETFHMPEPWNGKLNEAEILFVSSNPSFSIDETTSKLARDGKKGTGRSFQSSRATSGPWTGLRISSKTVSNMKNTVTKLGPESSSSQVTSFA